MKKSLLVAKATLAVLLLFGRGAVAQPNLIPNGDFEDRYRAPQTYGNISPGPTATPSPNVELKDWYLTPTNASNGSLYIASDGAPGLNPHTIWDYYLQRYGLDFSFSSHGGKGCVLLGQHDAPADHSYDNSISRELPNALLPGHTYQVGFWALRSVSGRYRAKLALWITDSVPSYDYTTKTVTPAIGNKIVESRDDILDTKNWTYVSGRITIPAGQTNNKWVTIGYSPSYDQSFDPEIAEPIPDTFYEHASFITYAVDDLSLVDSTCSNFTTPLAYQYDQELDDCYNVAHFRIANYNPSFTYTFTKGRGNPVFLTNTGVGEFIVKVSGLQMPAGATFTMTATSPNCGSLTSDELEATYQCIGINTARTANATTAYPNPATEIITIPTGAKEAILLNDKGKTLRKADASGKLDVQSLPDGFYNLQMQQDGKLINQRIQVKH